MLCLVLVDQLQMLYTWWDDRYGKKHQHIQCALCTYIIYVISRLLATVVQSTHSSAHTLCYIHLQPKQGPVICLILWLHSLRSPTAPVDSGMKIANYHEKCLQFVKPQTNIDYRYIWFWLADSVKGWRRQLVMITWENLLQDLIPFSDLSIDHLLHDVAVIVFSQSSEAH